MTDNTLEEWIAARGISAEDAIACDLGETDTADIDVHPSMKTGVLGVVIPYFNADRTPVIGLDGLPFKRMRRLGHVPKGEAKYLQGKRTGVHAYLTPFVPWPEIMQDTSVPVTITEGEGKAIKANAEGFPTIGIGGVYNFRDGVTKELLPELAGFKWAGRIVYLTFDSDVMTNPQVLDALGLLRVELATKRHADVRIVYLPSDSGGFDLDGKPLPSEKVGLDDFMLRHGGAAYERLIDDAKPQTNRDKVVDQINEAMSIIDSEQSYYDEGQDLFMDRSFLQSSSRFAHLETVHHTANSKGQLVEKREPALEQWMKHPNARRYRDIVFQPGAARVVQGERGMSLNLFEGLPAREGDVSRFLSLYEFLHSDLEPELKDFPLKLLAYKAQNPGVKVPIALMYVGTKGSGKSLFCHIIKRSFEPHATEMDGQQLGGDYNDWAERKLLVFIDEVSTRQMQDNAELLRYMIAQPEMSLRMKYRPHKQAENLGLFLFTTNYQDAASFQADERRYFVVGAPDKREDQAAHDWYDSIHSWANGRDAGPAVMHYLQNLDLQGWSPPTAAPMTGARYVSYVEGLDPIAALAEHIKTADANVVRLWLQSSMDWARETKLNMPTNAPQYLHQRIQQIETVLPTFPVRPFYSMSEIGLIFPALGEQLMGTRASKLKTYSPEQISSGLRTHGVRLLKNAEPGVNGFLINGKREPFLIIADTQNKIWQQPLTQAQFDAIIQQVPTFAELQRK